LYTALISSANSKVSALSANSKTEFKTNFNFYLVVCKSINDRTLSFNFSNYIMSFVVGQVNDKKMKLSEAADYILSAYTLDPTNNRVKENLKTLFEMLCRETTTDSVTAVNGILSKVKSCDSSFYNSLNNEYQEAKVGKDLHAIVEKFKAGTLSKLDALKKVYAMYESYPEDEGVCICLAQFAQVCIMEYIVGNNYNSSTVKNILNKILNNKSSQFRKQSSVFRQAYNDIWNQLPADTQLLLSDSSISDLLGQSLNENGRALKSGLDYMKQLGGFSGNSSPLSGLSGLSGLGRRRY
jgi:hypothetical protein